MNLGQIKENLNQFQIGPRFFVGAMLIVLAFAVSFPYPVLFPISLTLLIVLLALLLADALILFSPLFEITAVRSVPKLLGLGDDNTVRLELRSTYPIRLNLNLYDELPAVFQDRNFGMQLSISPGKSEKVRYVIRPLSRGSYTWGVLNVHVSTRLGFAGRRWRCASEQSVPCYPSILQMKQFELRAFARVANYQGIKRMRRLGHSYEFEQIKHYVQGDDIRSINWKATSRHSQLMVNQYQDERSQQVYCIIDKSRSMHMPFNGLSLLDYAINTSLVISNIALKKYDRTGLISFSDRIGTALRADRSRRQLKHILHALANEQSREQEADFDLLYRSVKNVISGRSLIFLFLNFESIYAMERALPVLRRINQLHLLVVVLFVNTELQDYVNRKVEYVGDIYTQTLARKLLSEKKHMSRLLNRYGIQTILTPPEELSLNTVNKYLELKARGLI